MMLEEYKDEKTRIQQSLEQSNARIAELESENQNLSSQLESLRADADGNQEKINSAAERIQGLLSKLESVQ